VHSGQSETARRVNSIGAEALSRDPKEPGGKLTESLELNEDVLRRDPAVSLRLLADRTGGFLINNTNDLAGAFRRIDEDRRFHYLLSYLAVRASGTLPLLRHLRARTVTFCPGTFTAICRHSPRKSGLDGE
jgi:hypothetical protein